MEIFSFMDYISTYVFMYFSTYAQKILKAWTVLK